MLVFRLPAVHSKEVFIQQFLQRNRLSRIISRKAVEHEGNKARLGESCELFRLDVVSVWGFCGVGKKVRYYCAFGIIGTLKSTNPLHLVFVIDPSSYSRASSSKGVAVLVPQGIGAALAVPNCVQLDDGITVLCIVLVLQISEGIVQAIVHILHVNLGKKEVGMDESVANPNSIAIIESS